MSTRSLRNRGTRDYPFSVVSMRKFFDVIVAWLRDRPLRNDVGRTAALLMTKWGDRALDVAEANCAAATGGFFDSEDKGFWRDVSREIRRRQCR